VVVVVLVVAIFILGRAQEEEKTLKLTHLLNVSNLSIIQVQCEGTHFDCWRRLVVVGMIQRTNFREKMCANALSEKMNVYITKSRVNCRDLIGQVPSRKTNAPKRSPPCDKRRSMPNFCFTSLPSSL
jgi:hypothetical protein